MPLKYLVRLAVVLFLGGLACVIALLFQWAAYDGRPVSDVELGSLLLTTALAVGGVLGGSLLVAVGIKIDERNTFWEEILRLRLINEVDSLVAEFSSDPATDKKSGGS